MNLALHVACNINIFILFFIIKGIKRSNCLSIPNAKAQISCHVILAVIPPEKINKEVNRTEKKVKNEITRFKNKAKNIFKKIGKIFGK